MSVSSDRKIRMNVAILGASQKEDRYSNKAQKELVKNGHTVFPVSIDGRMIQGAKGYTSLLEIDEPIDTVTVYLNSSRFTSVIAHVITLNPRRVIFNPRSESASHQMILESNGITVVNACTLVLLSLDKFDES